jgi:hypothetical protein
MAPVIPFRFSPPASEFEEYHLEFKNSASGQLVTWPIAGVTLLVPPNESYPSFGEIEKANGSLVKFHGLRGYSVGLYHEFLVGELPGHVGFKMGKIEATFGEATPLMAYLFDGLHREKYFGGWECISTVRIIGADQEEVELAVINAAIQYSEAFGLVPRLFDMDEDALFADEVEAKDASLVAQPPAIRDIEPLRFYYFGLSQADEAAACIYFYRVLEYYSFLANKKQMTQLRHNASLSEDDFAKQVLQLITKDEKGPFFRLVQAVANKEFLEKAVAVGVIKNGESQLLAEAIYALRNSIVHGKYSYGYSLHSTSIVDEENTLSQWRVVLRALAKQTIDSIGNRLM